MSEAYQAVAFELPYLDTPREDEALVRMLAIANLAEYAIASQYHRVGTYPEPIRIAGVRLETRQGPDGTYTIYRDPMTGDIYKTIS